MLRAFLLTITMFFLGSAGADEKVPSLHVLIATIGRESLFQMLESLEKQLTEDDYLTVVFDAVDQDGVYVHAEEYLKEFSCTTSIIMEPKNLGWWGFHPTLAPLFK